MELNKYNQKQLDAIKKQTGNQEEDSYMKRQYAAIENGLGRQQAISDKAAEEALRIKMQQESIVRALREYRKS